MRTLTQWVTLITSIASCDAKKMDSFPKGVGSYGLAPNFLFNECFLIAWFTVFTSPWLFSFGWLGHLCAFGWKITMITMTILMILRTNMGRILISFRHIQSFGQESKARGLHYPFVKLNLKNVLVPIVKCICSNWQMYLFGTQNVFVWMAKEGTNTLEVWIASVYNSLVKFGHQVAPLMAGGCTAI